MRLIEFSLPHEKIFELMIDSGLERQFSFLSYILFCTHIFVRNSDSIEYTHMVRSYASGPGYTNTRAV